MRFLNSKKNEIMALYPMSLCRFGVSYDIVKNVVFPPLYNGEDGAVAPQIIEKAKRFLFKTGLITGARHLNKGKKVEVVENK